MSRKQGSWILALFTITLLVSLIINIPARQLLRVVVVPAEVTIRGLQGSIAHGSLDYLSYQVYSLTDVNFELRPLCLFKLAVCYKLTSAAHELNLNIEANLISQQISIIESQINLGNEFIDAIPGLLVKPKGRFILKIEQMTLVDLKLDDLQAVIDWLDAGIQGEKQTLGHYNAQISRQADNISIQLGDMDSLLAVTGDVNVKLNGQFDVDLQFVSRPSLDRSVVSALEIAARKTGLNQFSLKKSGVVPAQIRNTLQFVLPSS